MHGRSQVLGKRRRRWTLTSGHGPVGPIIASGVPLTAIWCNGTTSTDNNTEYIILALSRVELLM
jgi:hypothetical protein